jgi:exo-1,4-beta-D-glucosaminidase
MNQADVRRRTANGQELSGDNDLQSSIRQDNHIMLFPSKPQTLTVNRNSADLEDAAPVVSVSGWNVPKIDILA